MSLLKAKICKSVINKAISFINKFWVDWIIFVFGVALKYRGKSKNWENNHVCVIFKLYAS
jgi:hypothetical protein